ncbi:MAG: ThuA domain-containing protein [Verrucomicrobiae bacterium]
MNVNRHAIRLFSRLHFAAVAVISLAFLTVCCKAEEKPLRILIFSGQNNHNWKLTTPELQKILTQNSRFTVDVTEHPETCTAESLAHYDVLLSNWNTFGNKAAVKEWPPKMREAFLNFVRDGGGFVVVHAGGASFADWADYQKIIGGTWGKNTGHGPAHTFRVIAREPAHPIVRGVAPFETTDELWHRMVVQPDMTVIATAFSALDKRGTGKDEPVAMVTDYGKGHGFNLVLGHNPEAMRSVGFQQMLLRGVEWAGTGTVADGINKITLPTTNP